MVSRWVLWVLLLGAWTGASESGVLAYKGQQYFQQGRYGGAYAQFMLALKASQKEADLAAEGRVLVAMATLATHAREFAEAERRLGAVRLAELDPAARAGYLLARMEFFNAQSKYNEAYGLWQKRDPAVTDKHQSEALVAQLYCEAAVAAGGSGNEGVADSLLQKASDLLDDEAPGQMAYAQARVADVRGEGDVVERYRQALRLSVAGQRYYVSGTVLLRLGELADKKQNTADAIDFYMRSAGVFEQLGLPHPYRQAAVRLVALQGEASPYAAKLKILQPALDTTDTALPQQ